MMLRATNSSYFNPFCVLIIDIPVRRAWLWHLLPFVIEAMACPYSFSFPDYKSRNKTNVLPPPSFCSLTRWSSQTGLLIVPAPRANYTNSYPCLSLMTRGSLLTSRSAPLSTSAVSPSVFFDLLIYIIYSPGIPQDIHNDPHDPNFDPTAAALEDESPYPEVRSAVANTDDPAMPTSTFRAWVIGLMWAILIPGVNQFFFFRYPSVNITQVRVASR
jgi:hypothetical protein